MEIMNNADLTKLNNLRLFSQAHNLFIPNNIEELILLLLSLENKKFIVLGNGSNVILNTYYENVILLKKVNEKLAFNNDGTFTVGASIILSKLVDFINKNGFGGIENLFSVPGSIGASVAMNAGTGEDKGIYLGNFVKKVKYVEDGKIFEIKQEDCDFKYRSSIFKNSKKIITEVIFLFPQKNEI